jgi:hypothetical protein
MPLIVSLSQDLDRLPAIHDGHVDIQKDNIEGLRLCINHIQGFLAIKCGFDHLDSRDYLEKLLHYKKVVRGVIHDEDSVLRGKKHIQDLSRDS